VGNLNCELRDGRGHGLSCFGFYGLWVCFAGLESTGLGYSLVEEGTGFAGWDWYCGD
jgi:hypothetical protein